MLMEDGFSYTKSELQLEDDFLLQAGSTFSNDGSESDELSESLIEKNYVQARQGIKTIEHRMRYFKKHLKLLRVEQGRIFDPFRQHLINTLGPEFKQLKMDWKDPGPTVSVSSKAHSIAPTLEKRESNYTLMGRHKSPSRVVSGRSVSADDFLIALDQISQAKGSEEMEKKLVQYQKVKNKKLLTIEKLNEYMKMLENKQQQRLIEEHRQSFRSFKYAGPSREGALFV
uniref:Tetratricopeptide repeat protein 21A n=1 Tax=Lygus hesperus TaxID=30085 RepID=A0A0A9WCM7_LYGHE